MLITLNLKKVKMLHWHRQERHNQKQNHQKKSLPSTKHLGPPQLNLQYLICLPWQAGNKCIGATSRIALLIPSSPASLLVICNHWSHLNVNLSSLPMFSPCGNATRFHQQVLSAGTLFFLFRAVLSAAIFFLFKADRALPSDLRFYVRFWFKVLVYWWYNTPLIYYSYFFY